ncbi:MAG: fumarate hydratase C-terminal domain-containing protein [Oscillospiraceae bacterium]|nr:fumarate hydratase C-terminal domain-containing protein [Oscillospiraceae bacterium]
MTSGVIKLSADEIRARAMSLDAGCRVLLSGAIYTARDAAHRRIFEMLDRGEKLPFELSDAVIYYAGPTPGVNGRPVGACGPTTSSRMDGFTPRILTLGVAAMIGKGERSIEVERALISSGAVYFCAVGGAGALIAKSIVAAEEIAFSDLGCESVKRLIVSDMPLTVGISPNGGNIFRDGREKYRNKQI